MRKNYTKDTRAMEVSQEDLFEGRRKPANYGSPDPYALSEFEQKKQAKQSNLDHLYKENYKPAKYSKAEQYRNSRSYMIKLPSGHYKELDLFEDTKQLQQFGLGPYFFIELLRRMCWLLLILSILEGLRIYITVHGNGLSNYSVSYSSYLIMTTLGNYEQNKVTAYDGYVMTIIPALCFLCTWLFYVCWKSHFSSTMDDEEEDASMVKPEKFCVQIEGIDEHMTSDEELERFFASFGPIYEISLVRRYKNKLSYFQDLDEMEEQIKEEELQVILGSGDKEHINSLRRKKEKLESDISEMQILPKTISAFVHFQFQRSKVDCLAYFNDHYLFSTCGHGFMRDCCCCCVDEPEQKYLFNNTKLFIKNQKVPDPDDINWLSFELNICGKIFRFIFSFLIILIFLALSCTIIGLCSIYINAHSANCDSVTVPATITAAKASVSVTEQECYCNANLVSSFSDSAISAFCTTYTTAIYVEQGIQYAIIFASTVTNILFGFVVDKMVTCVRPASQSYALNMKTLVYTIFLIFNTVLLPILIYADIFGFQAANYISFLTLISSNIKQFLNVSSLTFYVKMTTIWYRNVSPIFTNFMIINTIMVWVSFVISKCSANKLTLEGDQGKILQKHMNAEITSYQIDVYKETANFYMVLFMVFFFSSGIPVLMPIGLLNILSRYITLRSLLQSNSTRITGLGVEFMSLSLTIIPIILICANLFGEWMLTDNVNIYNQSASPPILSMALPFLQNTFFELTRQLYLPFYILMALLIAGELFLYHTLVRFCSCLCGLCHDKKVVTNPYYTKPFSEYAKTMNRQISYNIRNNDKFRNAILNMEKYLVSANKM